MSRPITDIFVVDKNGIHVLGGDFTVDYPGTGHIDTSKFEEKSFWFHHRNLVLATILPRYLAGGNFVDVGGGNGLQAAFLQNYLPYAKVALIEPGYDGCLNARNRGVELVYNTFFENFDFQEFNTSVVGLFDVIEHIKDDVQFLSQLSKRLKKGAKIVVTVPAYQWLWSEMDDYGHHYRRHNRKTIYQLARESNLQVTYFSYFFSYLVPLTYLVRALPYRFGARKQRTEILKNENKHHQPPGIINKLFGFLGGIELSRISKSSCPFGASIVAVFEV